MGKKQFKISINAPREKVWQILWNDDTYRQWTKPFSEGSHAVSDFKKGSKVLFLDGNGRGMVSRVADTVPNQYMSFEHLGEVKDGVEDTTSAAVQAWAGAHENYTLDDRSGQTDLTVEMDLNDEFEEMFNEAFPKALQVVKDLSESR